MAGGSEPGHVDLGRPVPREAWAPALRFATLARGSVARFLEVQAASGVVLLLASALALIWANSSEREAYHALWSTPVGVHLGDALFERSLHWVVNDVLMAIFFFVVGMEIRREIAHGELADWRRALLPVAAAVGGMLVPAGIYLAIAGSGPPRAGWGIPMATDIAFAIGVLALLGHRVPPALRVLLLSVAVIDDLGAILVIAVFYSSTLSIEGAGVAVAGLAIIFALRAIGVRRPSVYIAPATVVWAGIYAAGVHPTIAGVVVGLLTPVHPWLGAKRSADEITKRLDQLVEQPLSSHDKVGILREVETARRAAIAPAEQLIESLHPWVAFVVMPIFALANAGVALELSSLSPQGAAAATAVAAGLLIGKPMGIVLSSYGLVRSGLVALPRGITLKHLLVLGVVAGIGFTMSLFVGQLAFAEGELLSASKLGVLGASAAAILIVLVLGRTLPATTPGEGAAKTVDEAESSTEL